MKDKKKNTTLNDLLNPINCIGEEVRELDTNLKISDGAGYVLIAHPFIKNKLIFIRCHELFTLNGILISLRGLIHEKKKVDEEIANKLNDLILFVISSSIIFFSCIKLLNETKIPFNENNS